MKLACHLRELRGDRPLRELSAASGVAMSALSEMERGIRLPFDNWIEPLAQAYGAPAADWYPPTVLLALSGDDA